MLVICFINALLKAVGDYLFPCIAETMRKEVIRLLVLPGKQSPPPLGGYVLAEEASNKAIKRSEQLLMSNVSSLMSGCCTMLTNSYPVKVLFSLSNLCSYNCQFCVFFLIWEKNDENQCHIFNYYLSGKCTCSPVVGLC